ncbi:hypothetical protein HYDPIDRAFT_97259 [Hydnomerulius pinastri MD-312]|uniref:Unplaced genomic scaffold scaffold_31, whole genome shotgun sequence n=1 Tax=Hydnomerulius pinastri MD-312 TaxID=994086 RepID=A0A0C9V6B7_9AGAM|nr:hypothetical protein HYDPIDRAFT_97259 [Hydnomerulius pinastri MD-312]
MPPKRKNDESNLELTARERKKLKVADARTIAVQPVASGSGSGAANSGNAVAGSSKTIVRFDTMQGLPASIDVERFTEARAYEIDAMQKAIKTAGESSTHRAWQTLPRHLRRRAASHDVRRVPVGLREKARAEMDPMRRKTSGRPKRGKANQISRTEALLRRQRDKTWLETHIWHAKRAKMENMWGYRLAVTPTEKAFRPSHRASVHGSILHDASYYAIIELKGPQTLLQAALEGCCDPQGSGMKRCITGGRACETHIYKHDSYPFDLIGPITIIWQPLSPESKSTPPSEPPGKSVKRKGKGKGKQIDTSTSPGPAETSRVIWVRAHPAIFEDVFEALQTSASHALQAKKEKDPEAHATIEIADLRGCINAFEIMGPKSSQVIKGALSPAGGEDREDFKKFWESLSDLQTPGNIPRGMVIGLKVLDPRLKFPPKNAKPYYPDPTQPTTHPSPAFIFPSALTAQSEIWDAEKRGGLKKPKYKKKDIDERRAKNLVPGTPLNPLRQDDRIPILLIQRSLEPCPPSSSTSASISNNSQGIHGWTLLFPAGWSMPFLTSLVYTGTRIAGQRERTKQFFEAGVPGFPMDYPTLSVYDATSKERAENARQRWERTPPAKKPNYEKLGTRSPWSADWAVVLGLEKPKSRDDAGEEEGLVSTQRENPPDSTAMQVDSPNSAPRPWLLRGPKVPSLLSGAFITPVQFLGEINKLRVRHHMPALDISVRADDLMKTALVMMRTKMIGRGAPSDLANIYKMDDVEARKWIKAFSKKGAARLGDTSDLSEHDLGEIKPAQEDVVGYVTTGDVSLVRGEGFAIGAIPLMQYLALRKQAQRSVRYWRRPVHCLTSSLSNPPGFPNLPSL